jgi:hypothetical protein
VIEYCLDEHHDPLHVPGYSWSLVVVDCDDETQHDEMNDRSRVYIDRYNDSLLNHGISVIPVTKRSCPGMLKALCRGGRGGHVLVVFNNSESRFPDERHGFKTNCCDYRSIVASMGEKCVVLDAGGMDAGGMLGAISGIVNKTGSLEESSDQKMLVVGVVASWKRLVQLHKKGCIPLGWGRRKRQDDVRFVPVTLQGGVANNTTNGSCSVEFCSVDALLIKYSDFIEKIDWGTGGDNKNNGNRVVYSHALTSLLQDGIFDTVQPNGKGVVLIDSIDPLMDCVLDRVAMYEIIDEIARVARKTCAMPVRSAVWSVLDDHHHPVLIPCLLKPRAACGVEYAHQMALVLKKEGVEDCELDYPLVAQEYINHSGVLFKVYVAGTHVLVEQKQSMPDIPHTNTDDDDIPSCIEFDSLHGLPKRLPWISAESSSGHVRRPSFTILNDRFFQQLGEVVRQHVKFSVFGFDVVFDEQAGEAIIVDLNYFPSFGGLGSRDGEEQQATAGVSLDQVMTDAMLRSYACIV